MPDDKRMLPAVLCVCPDRTPLGEPLRVVRDGPYPQLALESDRLYNLADDDLPGYSRISSTHRFPIFVPAALSIVRMARAVLPSLPMTLPRSVCATLSSITVVFSPSTSVTLTWSGLSTSALAMSVMRSFIVHLRS